MSHDGGFEPRDVSDSGDPLQTKAFRFKKPPAEQQHSNWERRQHAKRRRHHHHSHDRRKRQKTSSHLADDPHQRPEAMRNLPPKDAFQESLFDALGDDEGAEFWQGVYGQPIHTYPNTYVNEDTGEVTQMDDEEYAHYVRRKMWERSREGIEAAKEEKRREQSEARRRKTRQQEKGNAEPETPLDPYNNYSFDFELDASLRRGQRRKEQKHWQQLWKAYIQAWEDLGELAKTNDRNHTEADVLLRNKISWPVESGKRKDVNTEGVQHFIKKCAEATTKTEMKNEAIFSILKSERIRWHPDKIQQRYGFMNIDDDTMQGVTAVFQILDQMWNEVKVTR